jgi:hypothetical protein
MSAVRRSLPLLAGLVLFACASYGPGPPIGGAAVDPNADFSTYRTFDFLPVPAGVPSVLPSLGYFGLEGAIARGFSDVGVVRSIGGDPAVRVAYYAGGRQVDTQAWGYRIGPGPVVQVADVPSTCLVVDVVDAGSRVLVWRGIATDALVSPDGVYPAVRQMFQQWPGPRAP